LPLAMGQADSCLGRAGKERGSLVNGMERKRRFFVSAGLGMKAILDAGCEWDRATSGTSGRAFRWPDWRATCPGLPSASSIKVWTWRVSG